MRFLVTFIFAVLFSVGASANIAKETVIADHYAHAISIYSIPSNATFQKLNPLSEFEFLIESDAEEDEDQKRLSLPLKSDYFTDCSSREIAVNAKSISPYLNGYFNCTTKLYLYFEVFRI
ncbi:hypothetical protein K6119_11130 [Paracrocinitomix mangrovi]|uniref:hypothetical protein n=1 Tax=Paracrocinitomix mangrovi TaxID=2862509 RepID=UPI001C8EA23A|nr:hypothetical protein [Paracrocinitomix mangrovi]UKN00287.1 hypothetical protein K6119_11130 [Paracrocinitomix mangrovi]